MLLICTFISHNSKNLTNIIIFVISYNIFIYYSAIIECKCKISSLLSIDMYISIFNVTFNSFHFFLDAIF